MHYFVYWRNLSRDIYYGIKTGYNKAFVIDNETKNRLVAEDNRSAEILKPVLRGKDIKRYKADWQGLWLINTSASLGIDIDSFPAIKKHLLGFGKDRLEQAGKILSSGIKSRKKTRYKWFELQDICAYQGELNGIKIVWQRVTKAPSFCLTKPGQLILDSACFLRSSLSTLNFILPILNSTVIHYWVKHNVHQLGASGYLLSNQYVKSIPIPAVSHNSIFYRRILQFASKIDDQTKKGLGLRQALTQLNIFIYEFFNFTDREIETIEGQTIKQLGEE